jgi:hypothetical protein
MGLSLRGVAVGAMERASEIIQEERAEAKNLVDSSIKMWTEMGLPVFRARKKQRRELEQAANILKNEGFSNDQIYTAMRQGKHQAVIDHVGSLKERELAVKPADIITFAQDDAGYQSTGMTMDQVLDGVMGKLNTGMSLSDAIADTTGKNVGGIQAALMKKRAGAVQSAFGIDPTELRSLARQDFTYGEDIGGTLNIVDPEAAAKAKRSMGPPTTGMTSAETTRDALFDFGGDLVGGKAAGFTQDGRPVYEFEKPGRRAALQQKVTSIVAAKEKEVGRSAFSAEDREDMQSELNAWATDTYGAEAEANTATTEAASKLDAIKNNMRSNTSWLESGQARTNVVQQLAAQLRAAGQATEDTAISKAYKIVFDMEKEIKAAQAASATSNNTGSTTDTSSDFAGGA